VTDLNFPSTVTLAIIGAGPAGLMAAQSASDAGVGDIQIFDAMPSVGRKLLLAGIGGLNITHSEPHTSFLQRYCATQPDSATTLLHALNGFTAHDLRTWCADLGVNTFIGSSGRVFPVDMKAAPLLRAWVTRLKAQGVQFHSRSRWLGFAKKVPSSHKPAPLSLQIQTPQGISTLTAQATVLALGGASWKRLGSDGAWQSILAEQGVELTPLKPANCGFNVAWSAFFKAKCAGTALKNIAFIDRQTHESKRGELVLTEHGIEGGIVYAHSQRWRDALAVHTNLQAASTPSQKGYTVYLNLLPQHSAVQVLAACTHPRGSRSWANHLASRLGINSTAYTLLRECLDQAHLQYAWQQPQLLAKLIQALPITLLSTRPLDEAISTAGGVAWAAMDTQLQLKTIPGVFCAGEMLDWEAPTGGYLLNGCWATGRLAGLGAAEFLSCLPFYEIPKHSKTI
jgi:uncharacterized flavoprotein (TIGR03862 family)